MFLILAADLCFVNKYFEIDFFFLFEFTTTFQRNCSPRLHLGEERTSSAVMLLNNMKFAELDEHGLSFCVVREK